VDARLELRERQFGLGIGAYGVAAILEHQHHGVAQVIIIVDDHQGWLPLLMRPRWLGSVSVRHRSPGVECCKK
jgi:hypothetical protein